MVFAGIRRRIASLPKGAKIVGALGLGAATLGGAALAAKGVRGLFRHHGRKKGVARLRNSLMKKQLKIKNIQADRKLFREMIKGV